MAAIFQPELQPVFSLYFSSFVSPLFLLRCNIVLLRDITPGGTILVGGDPIQRVLYMHGALFYCLVAFQILAYIRNFFGQLGFFTA